MYDLIVIKRKWYRNKWIIMSSILLIIVTIITCFSIGRVFFKYFNNKQMGNLEEKSTEKISEKQIDKHVYEFKKELEITEQIKNDIENIYNSEEKRVFLTFDDGPSKTVTIPILDLLKQENIKATFFTLGSRIEFYPEIVKRAYTEGHYIANHGYTHKYSSIYCEPQNVLNEYNMTETLIKNAIGDQSYSSHLFRFPGGSKGGKYSSIKKEAIELLKQNNVMHVDWNALTGDSEGKKTREDMMQYLIQTIGDKNSIVILMHDAGDKIGTYELLPEIISYLRERGYSFKNFYDIEK